MKIIAKPMEMVTVTDETGVIRPVKFKLRNEKGLSTVIKIDSI